MSHRPQTRNVTTAAMSQTAIVWRRTHVIHADQRMTTAFAIPSGRPPEANASRITLCEYTTFREANSATCESGCQPPPSSGFAMAIVTAAAHELTRVPSLPMLAWTVARIASIPCPVADRDEPEGGDPSRGQPGDREPPVHPPAREGGEGGADAEGDERPARPGEDDRHEDEGDDRDDRPRPDPPCRHRRERQHRREAHRGRGRVAERAEAAALDEARERDEVHARQPGPRGEREDGGDDGGPETTAVNVRSRPATRCAPATQAAIIAIGPPRIHWSEPKRSTVSRPSRIEAVTAVRAYSPAVASAAATTHQAGSRTSGGRSWAR